MKKIVMSAETNVRDITDIHEFITQNIAVFLKMKH